MPQIEIDRCYIPYLTLLARQNGIELNGINFDVLINILNIENIPYKIINNVSMNEYPSDSTEQQEVTRDNHDPSLETTNHVQDDPNTNNSINEQVLSSGERIESSQQDHIDNEDRKPDKKEENSNFENKRLKIVINKDIFRGKIYKSTENCCICINNFEKEDMIIRLKCDHIFHENCLLDSINFSNCCPLCRDNIQIYY